MEDRLFDAENIDEIPSYYTERDNAKKAFVELLVERLGSENCIVDEVETGVESVMNTICYRENTEINGMFAESYVSNTFTLGESGNKECYLVVKINLEHMFYSVHTKNIKRSRSAGLSVLDTNLDY